MAFSWSQSFAWPRYESICRFFDEIPPPPPPPPPLFKLYIYIVRTHIAYVKCIFSSYFFFFLDFLERVIGSVLVGTFLRAERSTTGNENVNSA